MMLAIFLILTYIVSLTLHGEVNVSVYNRYPNIKLSSPVYFCNCETGNEYSVEGMDDGAMMKIGFKYALEQDEPGGILMYEMQRNTRLEYQSSADTTSVESVEDTSKMMQLLVALKFDSSWEFRPRIVLVEHDNKLVLNEDKLKQLYDKIYAMPIEVYNSFFKYNSIYESIWLMYNNTILKITNEIFLKKGLELMITTSEGVKDEDTKSALWIDPER
jgi:hypothetical protein